MPVTITITDRLTEIAAVLPAAIEGAAEHAANTLTSIAIETCPVDDFPDSHRHGLPHMRETIKNERVEDHWEVSVQKDQAAAGEKTWAWFNNDGTVHYIGSHFFTDACVAAGEELQGLSALPGLGV